MPTFIYVAIVVVCPSLNGQCIPVESENSYVSSHQECVDLMPRIRSEVEYKITHGFLPSDGFIHANVCERR